MPEGRPRRRRRRPRRRRRARRRPGPARPVGVPRADARSRPARGGNGRGARKHGADGERRRARRPGRDAGARRARASSIADLARAGRPGRRSRAAATAAAATRASRLRPARRRASPRSALPGEEAELELRLKLLADAALVGLPNAGKSSLLAPDLERDAEGRRLPVHDARSRCSAPSSRPTARQLTVADVPGLIEGASEGVGLGHEFLAHLERARLLLHVIDASEGDAEERFAHDRRRARPPTAPASTSGRRSSS